LQKRQTLINLNRTKNKKNTEEDANTNLQLLTPTDPNYSPAKTVFADPTNFTIKHPLQNRWSLWYDNPGKKTNQASWADHLKKIVTFDTVEDFWRLFNNIRPTSKLTIGSNYHLFKDSIEPKWEHAENSKGGKWIVTVKGKPSLDQMWMWTVLACIGETFTEEGEICGCVASIRSGGDRIALWTKTATNEQAQKTIGAQFKKVLELPENAPVGYQCHADSLKRGSSFRNKNRYEV